MTASGIVAAFLAVDAEQKSLEQIAEPLSVSDEPVEPEASPPSPPAGMPNT
jgi:hypothetical protein